jgi:hypothetical protein
MRPDFPLHWHLTALAVNYGLEATGVPVRMSARHVITRRGGCVMTQKGSAFTPRPAAARDKRDLRAEESLLPANSGRGTGPLVNSEEPRHTRARVACDGGREGAKAANHFHLPLNSVGSIRHAAGVACG